MPCRPPGDLTNPGTEPRSPALQLNSLLSEPVGKPHSLRSEEQYKMDIFIRKERRVGKETKEKKG